MDDVPHLLDVVICRCLVKIACFRVLLNRAATYCNFYHNTIECILKGFMHAGNPSAYYKTIKFLLQSETRKINSTAALNSRQDIS